MPILDQLPVSSVLLATAGLLYLALAAHFYRSRWPAKDSGSRAHAHPSAMSISERIAVAAAIAAHAAGMQVLLFPANGMHFSFALAISVMMWLAVLVYWLESFRTRIESLQALVLSLTALAAWMPLVFSRSHILENAESFAFKLHFLSAMLAYSLFALAAVHAALMGFAERKLRQHNPPASLSGVPPLLTLEALVFRMVGVAFALLTLALGSGILSSEAIYGRALSFDHKTLFALLSWVLVATLLAGRFFRGWRGRTALRWLLAGFVALLLAYVGTRFVADILLGR